MGVEPIEMLHEPPHALVQVLLGEMPIETERVFPFGELAELDSLEDELFARMRPHPSEKHPAVGEFLPVVTRHFIDERTLAVNDLVMAQHKDEMFMERVEHRECDLALVISAVNRVFADVAEAVVHPAHVPLVSEAQSSCVGGSRYSRPCRGFLGDQCHAGMPFVADLVAAL